MIHAGDHGSTFGGNPFIAHVANKTFAFLSSKEFLSHVNTIARYFDERLQELASAYPFIARVKGMGLMKGLEVNIPVQDLVQDAYRNKLLVARAGENVLRFLPPLIIEKDQVDEAISILNTIFKTKGV